MIFPLALAIGTQLVLAAAADGVPTIDVGPVCDGIAHQGGVSGLSHDVRKERQDCVATEQSMRDSLVKQWTTFSPADRTTCLAAATKGGVSSYTELLTCLEMSRDVRKLRTNPDGSLGPGR